MGKESRARVLKDHQAMAIGRNIRVSPRKLNLVAQTIRGKRVERALNELSFSPKRIAKDVKKILQSAIANAENNHDLDVDDQPSRVNAKALTEKYLAVVVPLLLPAPSLTTFELEDFSSVTRKGGHVTYQKKQSGHEATNRPSGTSARNALPTRFFTG